MERQHQILAGAAGGVVLVALGVGAYLVWGQPSEMDKRMAAAERWIDEEFQPSVLSREEQLEEMRWFIEAAEPYQEVQITTVAENITTHVYEAEVLAEAFTEITGIEVVHDIIPEAELVGRLQHETETQRPVYDAYINDADSIGTHFRNEAVYPVEEFMEGEGRDVTSPTLDLDDFIGLDMARDPDGLLYQLPAQQFANLYWFRYDWFQRPDLREQFEELYGYELGVPVNWSAYEDIAEFFTDHVQTIDGERVYGHMDYGSVHPSLQWRFTDAWLSMAGAGDTGLPNGLPVDEWGVRMEGCRPRGSDVSRGGATNGPAAVYSVEKFIHWLENFAPPEAMDMTFTDAGPVPAQGNVAQQIFWYTAFTADMIEEGLPVVDDDGMPKWRMAPSPRGAYWEDGMKVGYQDAGSWTLLRHTPPERRDAAWLFAQFTLSKTVDLRRTIEGLTPVRESTIESDAMTEMAPQLGGLIEFYRSPARDLWTDTGVNIPDYPRMSTRWWSYMGAAISGESTPQEALDNLAHSQDGIMRRLEQERGDEPCSPRLNEPEDPRLWLSRDGAPKPPLDNEDPPGETVPYDEVIDIWE